MDPRGGGLPAGTYHPFLGKDVTLHIHSSEGEICAAFLYVRARPLGSPSYSHPVRVFFYCLSRKMLKHISFVLSF